MHGESGKTSMPAEIPVGLENLLALAAVNDEFADALLRDPEAAANASGVALTAAEHAILRASTPESLAQLAAVVRERLPRPERRRFLELATAAVVTLAAGGAVTVNRTSGPVALAGASRTALASITPPSPPTGSRPDRPARPRPDPKETPPPAGIRPDRSPTRGIRPDRPPSKKPKSSGSGCNR